MHPYTGDYTKQRKNNKFNFTYYTFTPRPLKGATLFKMDDELAALLVEAHHNLGLLEGLLQYAPNKNSFWKVICQGCFLHDISPYIKKPNKHAKISLNITSFANIIIEKPTNFCYTYFYN